jgi:2-oxo-3-hexenedioate decarboxylase
VLPAPRQQNAVRTFPEIRTVTPDDLLRHLDGATPWPDALRGLTDMAAAYALALAVRERRLARGQRPAGYKIGFTNRTIWDRYAVHAPIWGCVWDTTLVPAGAATVALAGLCQPRLEPEIVFGLAATPPAGATLDQLFDCIDWVAPGFEIVQSHAPGWKFSAAETVADGGLHGRLLIGPRRPLRALGDDAAAVEARLAAAHVRLQRGATMVEEGLGANVLDGPLHALAHFIHEQQRCPGAPRAGAGDVVTTGTWTDAWPLAPGEHWRAVFDAPLGEVEIRLG